MKAWHDEGERMVRAGKDRPKPGRIKKLAVDARAGQAHGADGQGRSRGDLADLRRHEALDEAIELMRAAGE